MPDSVSLTLAFELDLQTDPLGATLSLTVTDAISADVREQYLDSVYGTLVGAEGNLVFQAVQQAHETLQEYGTEQDYRVESIIGSFQGVVMAALESGFGDKLRAAVLDDAERRAREDLAPELKHKANGLLTRYGQRHGYDVGALTEAARVGVERTTDAVTITLYYPHPALLFERGTADHDITGDPLSFVWSRDDDPPEWVREQFEREGDGWRVFLQKVEVSGLPEAGFIRDALNAMRQQLRSY